MVVRGAAPERPFGYRLIVLFVVALALAPASCRIGKLRTFFALRQREALGSLACPVRQRNAACYRRVR
jgi:hypothetical protein